MIGNESEVSLKERVADISAWRNNCAVSCAAVFIVNAFLSAPKKLGDKAEISLTKIFNDYYKISLSIEQLRDIFSTVYTLPSDRQIILGPVLRDFLVKNGVTEEEQQMLSNEAFKPLAKEFGFNVVFYADIEKKIGKSNVIPEFTINPENNLALNVYYHNSHFDLVMDNKEMAKSHNDSNFDLSPHNLSIELGKEEELKKQIKQKVHDIYNKKQQDSLEEQISTLENIAKKLLEKNAADNEAKEAKNLAKKLQEKCATFFVLPLTDKEKNVIKFKQEMRDLIKDADPKIVTHSTLKQVMKNILFAIATIGIGYLSLAIYNKCTKDQFFFFHPSSEEKAVKSALTQIEKNTDGIMKIR